MIFTVQAITMGVPVAIHVINACIDTGVDEFWK